MNILKMIPMLLIALLMIVIPSLASGETLAIDNNGIPIQLSRYWSCESDTIPARAPTVADSIAVPGDAAEAVIIMRHQAGYVRPNSATGPVLASGWIYVPVNSPITIPVQYCEHLVYRSATGAARINILWKRM